MIVRQIGGDAADLAVQLRCGTLIEGRHAQNRSLTLLDLVDILRLYLCFQRQPVATGTINMIVSAGETTPPIV